MNSISQPVQKHSYLLLLTPVLFILVCTIGNAQISKAAPASPASHPASAHAAPAKKSSAPAGPSQAVCMAYLGRLRSKVINNWYLPDGSNSVTLTITVANDGSTSDIKSVSKPQNAPAETAAMDALSKCQPLEALPSGFPAGARLTIVFASKADPHGDSNSSVNLHIDPFTGSKTDTASAPAAGASDAGTAAPASGNAPAGTPATGTAEAPAK